MDAIGIDLGTTNCCMAVIKNGRPEVIPNNLGERTTPSFISFLKNQIIYGNTAKGRIVVNTENTIYDVKRFIGRNYNDQYLVPLMDTWGFKLINSNGQVKVHVKTDSKTKMYSPEMLSGMILKQLKKQAEQYLGNDISKAYITVPTYFNDAQRHATIDAGKLAGFKEVRLLNEPTAAAIAYSLENVTSTQRIIFVFDFGGGTFDVSIIKFKDRTIKVIAIDGDIQLGGNDVTSNIVKHYIEVIKNERDFDITSDHRKFVRFQAMCEDAKKQLSDAVDANLEIFDLLSEDFELEITREKFERINEDLFKKTIEVVERCLKRSKFTINQIDDIVVVGGSTRIRRIIMMLEEYFQKPLKFTINPDEAVAVGAAIAASKWSGSDCFSDVKFSDICPYTLGVETRGQQMNVVIPKYTELPAKQTKVYCTSRDGQTSIKVKVFSGDDPSTTKNAYLGCVTVSGFDPGPAKTVKLDETFIYDESGVLHVEVCERSARIRRNLKLELNKGRLTDEEFTNQKREIEEEYVETENVKYFNSLKQAVLDLCHNQKLKNSRESFCASTIQWLKGITNSSDDLKELTRRHDLLKTHLDFLSQ